MTAKEYLNRIRRQNYKVEQAERELTKVQSDILSLRTSNMSEKVTGTKESDLSDKYIKLERYFDEVNAEWDILIDMRRETKAMINMMPDEIQQAVLYARYINCLPWEQVATDMHYSWNGIFKLHGRALQSFERVYRSVLAKGI